MSNEKNESSKFLMTVDEFLAKHNKSRMSDGSVDERTWYRYEYYCIETIVRALVETGINCQIPRRTGRKTIDLSQRTRKARHSPQIIITEILANVGEGRRCRNDFGACGPYAHFGGPQSI
jgi:hypothetical protein